MGSPPDAALRRILSLRRGALRDRDGLFRTDDVRLLDLQTQKRADGQGARGRFRLLAGGRRSPRYQFHTRTARHYFLQVCGILPRSTASGSRPITTASTCTASMGSPGASRCAARSARAMPMGGGHADAAPRPRSTVGGDLTPYVPSTPSTSAPRFSIR